jgi:hypothetical protein
MQGQELIVGVGGHALAAQGGVELLAGLGQLALPGQQHGQVDAWLGALRKLAHQRFEQGLGLTLAAFLGPAQRLFEPGLRRHIHLPSHRPRRRRGRRLRSERARRRSADCGPQAKDDAHDEAPGQPWPGPPSRAGMVAGSWDEGHAGIEQRSPGHGASRRCRAGNSPHDRCARPAVY